MKPLFTLFLVSVIAFSCNYKAEKNFDMSLDKKLIENAIRNSISWAKDKDTSLLYSIIANDENFLEVHPNNAVVLGINEFKQAENFWLDPRFKAIKSEIWDLKITISKDGQVAWFYCMLNDINEWDGKPANWENTRWTGVLEKRDGKWRIVQQHFSFAQE